MAPNRLHPLGQGAGGGSLPGIYPAVERSGHRRRGRTPGATYVGTPPGSSSSSKKKREKLSAAGCVRPEARRRRQKMENGRFPVLKLDNFAQLSVVATRSSEIEEEEDGRPSLL